MRRTFEALTSVVSVTVDDDVPGHDTVSALVAAYPDSDRQPQLAFHLRGGARPALVCRDRYETPVEHRADLVPLFELDMYHLLVKLADPGWLLHAAALEHSGRVCVFAGPSGAGKTTLAIALIERGWKLLTEEIVLVDRELGVRGLARPIHLKTERAFPPTWTHTEYCIRHDDGTLRHHIVQPPTSARITERHPLHALVRIAHGADLANALEIIPPHVAFMRLWECTLRQDDDGVAAATHVISHRAPHALTSSAVADAVASAEVLITS